MTSTPSAKTPSKPSQAPQPSPAAAASNSIPAPASASTASEANDTDRPPAPSPRAERVSIAGVLVYMKTGERNGGCEVDVLKDEELNLNLLSATRNSQARRGW